MWAALCVWQNATRIGPNMCWFAKAYYLAIAICNQRHIGVSKGSIYGMRKGTSTQPPLQAIPYERNGQYPSTVEWVDLGLLIRSCWTSPPNCSFLKFCLYKPRKLLFKISLSMCTKVHQQIQPFFNVPVPGCMSSMGGSGFNCLRRDE